MTMLHFWLVWIFAVIVIFPIPGTIALRNFFLVMGLVALIVTRGGKPRTSKLEPLATSAGAVAAICIWLAFHSAVVAKEPSIAFGNLRGDWIVPLLTGTLSGLVGLRLEPKQAWRCLIAGLAAHIVLTLGWQFIVWISSGPHAGWPSGQVPIAERDYQSSVAGMLLALALGKTLASQRSLGSPKPEHGADHTGWVALSLSVVGDVVLRVRNGTLVGAVMLGAAAIALSRRGRAVLLFFILVAVIATASLFSDKRWVGLAESLSTGWNSSSLYWLTWDSSVSPRTSSGIALEESAYARAAWARQAVDAIAEHPLGLGFGRDAFGRAIELKYGRKGMVSSHSGWLDFTLATGVPGLALLLIATALAIRGGWRQYRQHDDPAGLMFSFLVGGYLLRCLVDGHFSGWRLGLFAFICGVLIGSMKREPQPT